MANKIDPSNSEVNRGVCSKHHIQDVVLLELFEAAVGQVLVLVVSQLLLSIFILGVIE